MLSTPCWNEVIRPLRSLATQYGDPFGNARRPGSDPLLFLALRVDFEMCQVAQGRKLMCSLSPNVAGSGRFVDLFERPKTRTSWFAFGFCVQYNFQSEPIRDFYALCASVVPLRQLSCATDPFYSIAPATRRLHTMVPKLFRSPLSESCKTPIGIFLGSAPSSCRVPELAAASTPKQA